MIALFLEYSDIDIPYKEACNDLFVIHMFMVLCVYLHQYKKGYEYNSVTRLVPFAYISLLSRPIMIHMITANTNINICKIKQVRMSSQKNFQNVITDCYILYGNKFKTLTMLPPVNQKTQT